MKRHILLLLTVLLAAASLVAQAPAPGADKIQVLIITGSDVGAHVWRETTPGLRKILEDTGRFEVKVTEEFRGAGPETLAPYDLVVLNYFDRKQDELWWGDRAQNALLDWVRGGKGIVVYHFSTAAFTGWTEYEKMCAGNWRPGNGHHSPSHDYTVKITDSVHPIMRGIKPSFEVIHDELYANLKWQPKDTYHVLATAWDDHSLYKNPRQPTPGPGIDQPIMWTVKYGQGNVFATVLGHTAKNLENPGFQITFARGAEWAATGKVTLPVPAEMVK